MRRRIIALLLLLALPLHALAAPSTPYDPALMLVYPALSPAQQGIFDLLYAAAAEGTAAVTLPGGSTYDDAVAAADALLADAPELVQLGPGYTVSYYQREPELATAVTLQFIREPEASAQTVTLAAALAGEAEGTDWDKALWLHDRLCDRVTYGAGASPYDAYGALAEGQAVCEGYAESYALLCRLAGLRCGVLTGTAWDETGDTEPHAWNEVLLAQGAMQVDATWDDPDASGGALHDYFGLTDERMARDHAWAETFSRPVCDSTALDWFAQKAQVVAAGTSEAALCAWWETQLADLSATRGRVDVRFAGEAEYALFRECFDAWIDSYNERMGAAGFYGSYVLRFLDSQRTLALWMQD